jgi:hypothetical protein
VIFRFLRFPVHFELVRVQIVHNNNNSNNNNNNNNIININNNSSSSNNNNSNNHRDRYMTQTPNAVVPAPRCRDVQFCRQ